MKQYIIPHNFKDNGRVLNLFPAKRLWHALIAAAPLTFIIFNLPVSLNNKLFCVVFFVSPPTLAILLGYSDWLVWYMRYLRLKKIYLRGGSSVDLAYPKTYSRTADAGSADRD